ncbi:hypothetical protein Lalb_Chr15g0084811 [Lupinus albus]|uniref:Uncharacterized protein n=1 Tax=Lupinus albus TaxID=3870 RepID=A0A6A4PEM3_LUPAL|nr:hypothetical protein Lalb_Chr15g0084811 [Lupinus albus]
MSLNTRSISHFYSLPLTGLSDYPLPYINSNLNVEVTFQISIKCGLRPTSTQFSLKPHLSCHPFRQTKEY